MELQTTNKFIGVNNAQNCQGCFWKFNNPHYQAEGVISCQAIEKTRVEIGCTVREGIERTLPSLQNLIDQGKAIVDGGILNMLESQREEEFIRERAGTLRAFEIGRARGDF